MHVAVQHRISDPERFFSTSAQEIADNAPAGVQPRQFFPSNDRSAAVCLWEGNSIDAVRSYVDSVTGEASQNTYFEIDTELAMGLPEAAAASA
jgi:hypothetical protein